MKVAVGLARCGFGDTLLEAVWKFVKGAGEEGREELEEWLVGWREDVAKELATNSQGHLPSKRTALSKALLSFNSPPQTGSFPDIRILLYYTTPLTSETYHRSSRNKIEIDWTKGEPDLGKIAGVCELYFEWGWKAMIVKRCVDSRSPDFTDSLSRQVQNGNMEWGRMPYLTSGNCASRQKDSCGKGLWLRPYYTYKEYRNKERHRMRDAFENDRQALCRFPIQAASTRISLRPLARFFALFGPFFGQ
jgi:hypothetical protein